MQLSNNLRNFWGSVARHAWAGTAQTDANSAAPEDRIELGPTQRVGKSSEGPEPAVPPPTSGTQRAGQTPLKPNALLEAFGTMPAEQKLLNLRADAAQLEGLLAARRQRGGSGKLDVLVVDAKGGSGHTIASEGVRAVLEDSQWPASQHLRVGRVDFHGDEEGLYAVPFDALMADEQGRRIRLRHLFKEPLDERLWFRRKGRIRATLDAALEKQGMSPRPDVIVCVQSAGIAALAEVAKEMNAQLRVQPTDFGLGDWRSHVPPHDAHDLTLRYDLPVKHAFVVDQLRARGLDNYNVVGMPLRREFAELPRRLASGDAQERAQAEADVRSALRDASKGRFRDGDRSVVVMMGGKGARPGRFLNYLEGLLIAGPQVLDAAQKMHVFVPAVHGPNVREDLRNGVAAGVSALLHEHPKGAKQVKIHLLPRLSDQPLARLMKGSVCITKAGGLTSFELAALGAKALLNMRLSKFLPWERNNVKFLQARGQGFALPVNDKVEREALPFMLQRAWAAEPQPVHAVDFAAVYQRSIVQDAIARLQAAKT